MGSNHIRVLKTLSLDCELVGIYDTDKVKLNEAGLRFSVDTYTDISALLSKVDAVTIAVPTIYHFATCQQCFEHNVHVLVEKPLAADTDEADILIRKSRELGLLLNVGHIERFNPAFDALKCIFNRESVISVDFRRLSPYNSRIKDVDVVQDLMIHDLDLACSLFNETPQVISALGVNVFNSTFVDHAAVQLRFKNNEICTLTASRVTEQKIRQAQITCRDRFVIADFLERKLEISHSTFGEFNKQDSYRQEAVVEKVYVPSGEPLREELASFIKSVELKMDTNSVSAKDGRRALALMEEINSTIYRQLLEGKSKHHDYSHAASY